MFDKYMIWVYSFTMAYHALRGSGMNQYNSMKGAYDVASESKMAKTITEFQHNMWESMKEISRDRKL